MMLHPVQAEFVDCQETISGFVGGRGTGKTTIGAYKLLTRAEPEMSYAVVTPTYPMMRDASLKSFLDLGRRFNYIREFHKTDMIAVLGNGAHILFRSADTPDRLRGPNLSGVWLDEASQMKREAFEIVVASLREGGQQGWLMATFTPNGRSHWTYDVFAKDEAAKLFTATTRDNPFLPAEFYDTVRHQYTGLRAEQELEGKFVDIEGAEWPAELFPDSIWFDEWPGQYRAKVSAVDPSKGVGAKYGDDCAFVWLLYGMDGKFYVDAYLKNDLHLGLIVDTMIELQRRWQFAAFGIETDQFQELIQIDVMEKSKRIGVPFPAVAIPTKGINKQVRIRQLTPLLSHGLLRFKAGSAGAERLVNQMRDFPLGDHDDGPDALHMAVLTLMGLMGAKPDGLGNNLATAMGGVA
jgi:PBSX family phage terminase large subunit